MQGETQEAYMQQGETPGARKVSISGYELLRVLGEGAFGTVYFAKQKSTGQFVALKLLKLDRELDSLDCERQIKRFEKETRLCAGLHHPNIVRLLDKGQLTGKKIFAVFEYIPGETLKTFLQRQGALPVPMAGELMSQLLDAIAAAHRVGVVHRDLKPGNIMVTKTGSRQHLKILDYGIGTFVSNINQINEKTLTLTHETIGTPSYSSPEQLRGEPATVRSDIYAWGLILLECLTGRVVMNGASLAEVFHKQLSPQDVQLPPAIVGHELGRLLRRVLQKDPQKRVGQAERLFREFAAINFNEIVGHINYFGEETTAKAIDATGTKELQAHTARLDTERRSITVLACKVQLSHASNNGLDAESIDHLQANELSYCTDIALRYGAYQAGALGDTLLFYYGYPYISDTDVRRAARTALELSANIQRRNSILQMQHGAVFDARFSLHSGVVICKRDQIPSGSTANIALELVHKAKPGHILVSAPIKHLLRQHASFNEAAASIYPGEKHAQPCYHLTEEKYTEAYAFDAGLRLDNEIVGRVEELNQLSEHWRQAKRGSGGAVLLHGEAGIGKSCLCAALKNKIYGSDVGMFEVRCLPEQKNRALYPVLELLKYHIELSEDDTALQKSIKLESALKQLDMPVEQTFPVLCAWFSLPLPEKFPLSQLAPKEQKKIMLMAAEKFVAGFSAQQPCLLILEDLHWADPTTLEFLQKLIKRASTSALLIVLSARTQFLIPDNLEFKKVIVVNQLSNQEAERLITNALSGRPVSADAMAQILQRAGGVPLFVQELMRMLLDQEILNFSNGVYAFDKALDTHQIPITLLDLLNERLCTIGLDKEIAQLTAALGRESEAHLLAAVAGCDECDVQTRLESLIEAGLLYKQRRVGGPVYLFRHMLIRDAAYESIPIKTRTKVHHRIAKVIEASPGHKKEPDFALLAQHWSKAKVKDSAIENFIKAGQRAESLYAYHEAKENFKCAMEEVEAIDDDPQYKKVNALYGQALEYFADASIALAEHDQGRDALYSCLNCGLDQNSVIEARLYRKIGKSWETHHHHDKALDCYQSAVDRLKQDKVHKNSDDWLQEWLEVSKAQLYVHYWRNDVEVMEELLKQVKPTIEKRATPLQQAGFLDDVLHLLLRQSRFQLDATGVAVAYDALLVAKAANDFAVLSWAQFMLGLALLFNENLVTAEEEMQAALSMAKKCNDVTLQARCLTYLTIILRRQHKIDEVEHCCNQALDISEQAGMHDYIATAKANAAWFAWKKGDQVLAEKLAAEAEAIWTRLADSYPYPMQWLGAIVLLDIHFKNGHFEEVGRYIEKVIADDQTKLNQQFNEKASCIISLFEEHKSNTITSKLKQKITQKYKNVYDQALMLGYL